MHYTAIANCKNFFDCYAPPLRARGEVTVVEIGSQDVNGSLRGLAPKDFRYIGVDMVGGKGVDVVLDDPYSLPFDSESADIVISSSCFEHSEMFWVLFLEVMRVLKPAGLFYLNVPSNGIFHRYPVDCWRFYPDSGTALVAWSKRNGINVALLESFTSRQREACWNDFVAVFLKDETCLDLYPERIIYTFDDFFNGKTSDSEHFVNFMEIPEDRRKLRQLLKYATAEVLFRRLKLRARQNPRVKA